MFGYVSACVLRHVEDIAHALGVPGIAVMLVLSPIAMPLILLFDCLLTYVVMCALVFGPLLLCALILQRIGILPYVKKGGVGSTAQACTSCRSTPRKRQCRPTRAPR